jgi:hypothetical protein
VRINPKAFFFLPGILLLSCAVGLIAEQDVRIEAPLRPAVWAGMGAIVYRAGWVDKKGQGHEEKVAEGQSLTIRLERGYRQAILFQPVAPHDWCKPAGFLYPFDVEPGSDFVDAWWSATGKASFGSGYAAAVALALERAGYHPWNWPVEKLANPGLIKHRDPWTLPPWSAAERLIRGEFRLSLFPSAKTVFELPDEGPWWPESALCPPPLAEAEKAAASVMLSEGLHTFSNGKEFLCVKVEAGEIFVQRRAKRL